MVKPCKDNFDEGSSFYPQISKCIYWKEIKMFERVLHTIKQVLIFVCIGINPGKLISNPLLKIRVKTCHKNKKILNIMN